MTGYPFTSRVTYDELGMPQYDRAVDSAFLRKVYARYFSDGIFYRPASALQVVAYTGMQTKLMPGVTHIQGAVGIQEDEKILTHSGAEAQDRIDTIVLRLDLSDDVRDIDAYIVKGTAAVSPVAPSLTRNNTVWELGVADVLIRRNSSTIGQADITDTRLDASRCGVVAQAIEPLDTAPYFEQITAMKADLKRAIAGIIAGTESMLKTTYDTDKNGIVDAAEKLAVARKIGDASFDGSSDVTLQRIGAATYEQGEKADSAMPGTGGEFTGNVKAYETARTTRGLFNEETRAGSTTGTLQAVKYFIDVT